MTTALAVASDPSELLDILSSIAPLSDEMRDSIMEKLKEELGAIEAELVA